MIKNEPTPHAHDLPVAVIAVTYSPGRHLAPFLESLPQAASSGTYVILADNGSTDGVPEQAAQDYANVEFFPTGGNLGYGPAINAAARRLASLRDEGLVRPDYFVISNPDVEFMPGAIDELARCLFAESDRGATGPQIVEADGSAYPSARNQPNLVTGIGHALLSKVWPGNPFTAAYKRGEEMDRGRSAGWLSGACLAVRWEAFDQIGGFDERYFMYFEDIDFGDRLTRAGWVNQYCPAAKIVHDQGHSANAHSQLTLRAHHASAYRFQSDRHPRTWQAPLRWALFAGLKLREGVELRLAGKSS
ncbi:glycosyltransferase family 2 protein [Corynebacterium sp. S7]